MLNDEVVQSVVQSVYAEEERAEEEPKESRNKFQTLFNLLPDPVVIVDGYGKFLAVNDKVEEMTGFKRRELLGKNFLETKVVTEKSKKVLVKNLAKRMMGMHIAPYEVEVLTKDGKKLTAEVNAVKIEYDGKPADLVVFHDIAGIRSELAVPVEIEDRILGVLNVESKKLEAFDERDVTLLQILASHSATAISNLEKRGEIEKRSSQLASLMKISTKMISSTDLRQRLQTIAEAIRELGWRRVVISVRDENLEVIDLVTEGLTKEEVDLLLERKAPGNVWRERLGPKYDRFKIGEFYYLPWSDPWVRENVYGVPASIPPEKATTYSGVPSKLAPEEMVDWHPQDMLYAPLRLPEGRIVGIISMDDPSDGRRPTKDSLIPLKCFYTKPL
jgi:PAS domain S-box-containing protein